MGGGPKPTGESPHVKPYYSFAPRRSSRVNPPTGEAPPPPLRSSVELCALEECELFAFGGSVCVWSVQYRPQRIPHHR